ncbi:methylglyoxal synthase [Halomonas denitrificans]|uniref:methylglyoxal synthase n=1 Tax=Halomonas TaxID=2745 RepID=UPI001C97A87E|nr:MULTISPECIES: methylglyoxal synthase [Halomonas]MED5296567.1 methylglyoxal synthase [Pseudomonadota bacterium]MBY5925268.1 methylglyoxal synthase [Halomonas sp. DP4Y7-2]MBY5929082.1 methylglyoxal synthase [Halomonas sp. DP8Y7-3]MBY5983668.1 methylglyoxal synthase [Halomonas sp. DP5Y7-2]MBY6031366.1 methylglyoxal synthase [Halomonas sp. DP8Y7-1]
MSQPVKEVSRVLPARKRIALVAHDGKKQELMDWASRWKDTLTAHQLVGTGTTAARLSHTLGLDVEGLMSGPLGGDQQIGARITEQALDLLIFFWDPFSPQPHDPDVKALLRLAALWNVPVACNPSSADFMMSSPWLGQDYEMRIPDAQAWISSRSDNN